MEEKKQLGEKLGEFFAGKGFYIVLLLCAGLIATSIWLMADRSGADVEPTGKTNAGTASVSSDELPSLPAMKVVEDPTVPTEAPRRPTTGKLPPLSEEEEAPAAVPVPEPPVTEVMAVEEPAPPVDYFIWPVNGALLRAYSVEALSYDPTMGDWRVHGGWDIAAPLGEHPGRRHGKDERIGGGERLKDVVGPAICLVQAGNVFWHGDGEVSDEPAMPRQ